MRERGFFLLTLPFATGALLCGLLVGIPRPLPAYALQAAPVYRAEVGLAIFVAGYLVTVCIRLAWHGQTFTRIGSTLEVPEIQSRSEEQITELRRLMTDLLVMERSTDRRLNELERRSISSVVDPHRDAL